MQLAYAERVRQLREHLAVKYVQVVSDVKCDDLNGEEKMHQHEIPNTENDDGVMALLPSIVACSLPCLEVLIEGLRHCRELREGGCWSTAVRRPPPWHGSLRGHIHEGERRRSAESIL